MEEEFLASVPQLKCFREYADAPEIVPGRSERAWMDASTQRFAYRCTPLTIANASGWELLLPKSIAVSWNGGLLPSDVTTVAAQSDGTPERVAASVFGHGVLTFHPGYLFRTSPGWALCARGAPNAVKDGIVALEGLIETDWLPFTFTMNWKFTRPGTVIFEKGECFCFLSLVPHGVLDVVEPKLCNFSQDPALKAEYEAWRQARFEFQARVARGDPEAVREGWQRNYLRGKNLGSGSEPIFHISKRKLKPPRA